MSSNHQKLSYENAENLNQFPLREISTAISPTFSVSAPENVSEGKLRRRGLTKV